MKVRRDPLRPLLLGIAVFAFLHHADHVLRTDHSGWPFQPEVTPFTFSLLVYPVLLADYLAITKPWLRVGLLSAGLAFLIWIHITIETPVHLYQTWSTGASTTEANPGVPNLLGVSSPVLGIVANLVLVMLLIALLATLTVAARQALTGSRINRSSSAQLMEVD